MEMNRITCVHRPKHPPKTATEETIYTLRIQKPISPRVQRENLEVTGRANNQWRGVKMAERSQGEQVQPTKNLLRLNSPLQPVFGLAMYVTQTLYKMGLSA